MCDLHAAESVPIISLACFTAVQPPERTGTPGYLTFVPFVLHLIGLFVRSHHVECKGEAPSAVLNGFNK